MMVRSWGDFLGAGLRMYLLENSIRILENRRGQERMGI